MPDAAPAIFPTTRASLIFAVRKPELRAGALAGIVETYWKPLYKYARLKWKRSPEGAQDLTQDFFADLLERDLLTRWDPSRAAFRTYIRLCFDGHAMNEINAANRLKRGGGVQHVGLDFAAAEIEISRAAQSMNPEELFHREWQHRMFELALSDLSSRCETNGHQIHWYIFEQYDLAHDARPTYDELASRYGIPITSVTNYLAWARRELRRALLDRLARTTAGGADLRREARDLFRATRS